MRYPLRNIAPRRHGFSLFMDNVKKARGTFLKSGNKYVEMGHDVHVPGLGMFD